MPTARDGGGASGTVPMTDVLVPGVPRVSPRPQNVPADDWYRKMREVLAGGPVVQQVPGGGGSAPPTSPAAPRPGDDYSTVNPVPVFTDDEEPKEPNWIGVPAGYRVGASRGGSFAPQPTTLREASERNLTLQTPRYIEGDQWTSFVGMNPGQRAFVQQRMADLGLYGSKEPVFGAWTADDASAIKDVLAYANATGTDWIAALNEMATLAGQSGSLKSQKGSRGRGGAGRGGGGGGGGLRLPNEADLIAMFQKVSVEMTGQRLPPEQAKAFAQSYIATYQATALSPQGAPDPQVAAENYLTANMPGETGATAIADTFNNFLKIIGGSL